MSASPANAGAVDKVDEANDDAAGADAEAGKCFESPTLIEIESTHALA